MPTVNTPAGGLSPVCICKKLQKVAISVSHTPDRIGIASFTPWANLNDGHVISCRQTRVSQREFCPNGQRQVRAQSTICWQLFRPVENLRQMYASLCERADRAHPSTTIIFHTQRLILSANGFGDI